MSYRNLQKEETDALTRQGCLSEDWSQVLVAHDFNSNYVHQVRFEGDVRLGIFNGQSVRAGNLSRSSGLYSSHIKNCEIKGEAYLSGVGLLANYLVENEVIIENVSSMTTEGETTFGGGTEIEVLNEGGGREIPLFDQLSSQIAYLMANYRHQAEMIAWLKALILKYTDTFKSGRGTIQSGCSIRNAGVIRNVRFGPMVEVSGAELLEEGSVIGCPEDPVSIGEGVIARNFIILSGSQVNSGAVLDKCFVGQGVRMGKQFSGENSLFFANCEAFHGEGVSLFAGPYSITHHKSTLMIAAMLSFYNAGSGTNQSNHMYKLGPLHQGILERGSKTGSFSYLLWPSRIGAFSVVMDKHGSNFDTSWFPFSYITLEGGRSMLTPAMNLFTVGTKRDSQKWPNRDRRKDPNKLDILNFEVLSPYIVGKIIRGSELLQELLDQASAEQKIVTFNGIGIKRLLLKTCRKYYQIALKKYYGDQLLSHLTDKSFENIEDLRSLFSVNQVSGEKWIDISGMLAPSASIDEIVEDLKNHQIDSIEKLSERLKIVHDSYHELAWGWYAQTLKSQLSINLDQITPGQLIEIIRDWQINSTKLNNMILKDAQKEFDSASRIGFGVDGDEETRDADFAAVRGTYEENEFIQKLKAENEEIENKAHFWIERFGTLEASS